MKLVYVICSNFFHVLVLTWSCQHVGIWGFHCGILPQHYTETQHLRPWLEESICHLQELLPCSGIHVKLSTCQDLRFSMWYPTATLHGDTTPKTLMWSVNMSPAGTSTLLLYSRKVFSVSPEGTSHRYSTHVKLSVCLLLCMSCSSCKYFLRRSSWYILRMASAWRRANSSSDRASLASERTGLR